MNNMLFAQITNPAIDSKIGVLASGQDAASKFAGFIGLTVKVGVMLAAVMCLVYLLWGGIDWVVSGGDKGNVENAKNKITHAIIGLAAVVLLVAVVNFLGGILGINLLNLSVPTASDFP
jgi:Na+/melibiose symporter-like transporter